MSADRDAALGMFDVSRETVARIEAFLSLQKQWQARTNLIAPSTLPNLWTRHVADSLQLLELAPNARVWLDIGSGGGYPGIVLACALADRPEANVYLVERTGKKAAFLREALRVSGGVGEVIQSDIRECAAVGSAPIEVVTARAVAPLATLLGWSAPWLSRGATGLYFKGEHLEAELKAATISWDFAVQHHPSRTGPGTILEITQFRGKRATRIRQP